MRKKIALREERALAHEDWERETVRLQKEQEDIELNVQDAASRTSRRCSGGRGESGDATSASTGME